MQLNPYIFFNGDCEAAFNFYAKVLGGEIKMMMKHGGTPASEHVSPDWQDKILHARLEIGEWVLMASDAPPDQSEKPGGFYINLQIKEPAEAERLYNALVENGSAIMPIAQTFWATRFAMLKDQFGIPWMINCE